MTAKQQELMTKHYNRITGGDAEILPEDNRLLEVSNPYTGATRELTPMAESVYSLCIGAERLGQYKIMQDCLGWFRKWYPSEYMDLLD